MKKILVLLIITLAAFASCKKDDFMDRFVPEVLYYEKDKVENADFTTTTLAAGITEWNVKCRVSAPSKLKEIRLYKTEKGKSEELLETYTDFQLTPNVFNVKYLLENIAAETVIRIDAADLKDHHTVRSFTIKVTP
ncbi:hypothetical protein [Chitinophaga barathri]|uniref:Uncharacterized protein n=1 Tax=Chitinophaga barathri TaxID=1647451 RepID=A0A3N4MN77_9BACT|nr:hypothetical protein [Chitinophaga barathri]RPD41510.1 hypothetical protein EG028_09345 [Chitinophaga barathri]